MDNNNQKKFIDLSKKNNNTYKDTSSYPTQYAENNSQMQFQNTNYNHSQSFQQNTNNPPVSDYNNTNNNYQQFPYQPTQNNYQQSQSNYQQSQNNYQQDYKRERVDSDRKKTPVGMYIMLIAVIIFFAVIIVAMSTIMKAMVNKNNKNSDKDDLKGNITLSDSADDEDSDDDDEDAEDKTEDFSEEITTTMPVMVEEIIEPVTEVVTVTVIVEVPAQTEPPVIEQNYTDIYESGFYGYIATKKDPLNVRSEPSKSAKIVTSIPKGTSVYVYYTSEYDWYYTTYDGKSGFVSADYVTAEQYHPMTAVIATKSDPLNLRETASKNGKIITTIPKGTTVNVIEYGDDWCYISWGQYYGYASTDYLAFGQ